MMRIIRDLLKVAGFTLIRELAATGSIQTLVAHQAGKRAPVVLRVYGEGPDAKHRLEVESAFLGGVDARCVARPSAIHPDCCNTLVLDDTPVNPLIEPSLPGVGVFLELAIGMARAVGVLHDARKLHLALSADCFVCDRESNRVVLMDLGGACLPLPQRPRAAVLYASPEVLGAMRWPPDVRSDLYSLGAIFYELLSGVPPFQGLDEREIVHAHLARIPAALHAVRPGLPHAVVRLVDRLLAKSPDERYLSVALLCQALEQCKAALGAEAANGGGPLGGEVPEVLRMPRSLHGRTAEERLLRRALEATRRGVMQVVMVAGRSGVGKTALVDQFLRHHRTNVCIQGKFDASSASVPYSALSVALNGAIHQLFAEPREVLAAKRRALSDALAGNGAVINSIVPDVEMLLGPQRSPPTLGPVENQRRFNRTFCALVRGLASAERPLVLFIDDLQWADRSSVELLIVLLTELRDAPILILGAYRDDAIPSDHPVGALLRACGQLRASFLPIELGALDRAAVTEIFAEMLDTPMACVGAMADAACEITEGNALRLIELLKQLHGARRLARKADGTWFWERVEGDGVALGLLRGTLETVPEATREVLAMAACLGDRLDLELVSGLCATSVDNLEGMLAPAVVAQLVVWLAPEGQKRQLVFRHDKIRDAARERLPAEERERICWTAATMLHKRGRPLSAEDVFRVARYYNEAKALYIVSTGNGPAQQNLQAARVAHRATAYQAAIDFLNQAQDWLSGGGRWDGWAQNYQLCMSIHKQMVESNYLAGRFDATEQSAQEALSRSTSEMDTADVYRMLTIMHTIQSDYAGAIALGRKGLHALHIDLPSDGYRARLDEELERARLSLGTRSIEGLIAMDECESPESRLAMRLLVDIAPAAWFCNPELYAVIVAKSAALALAEGVSAQSANIFATYGLVLATERNENKAGYAFGKLGMAFAERFDNDADRCKTACIFGAHINHWVASVNDAMPLFAKGWAVGARAGEIQWAGYISQWWVVNLMCAGAPIPDVLHRAASLLHYNIATKHEMIVDTLDGCRLILQELANGEGEGARWEQFDARDSVFVARCESHHSGSSLCNYYVFKSFLMLLRGDYEAALAAVEAARQNAGFSRGAFTLGEIPFFRSLATMGLARSEGRPLTAGEDAVLAGDRREMKRLAESAPANFLCRQLLLEAELRDFAGAPVGHTYDLAMEAAQERERVQVEALATELAARSYLRHGMTVVGRTLLQRAVELYARWGCECKVALLRSEVPLWLLPAAAAAPDRTFSAADLETLLKASSVLASELDPQVVLGQGLKFAMEYAGASQGCLFMKAGDEWEPRAAAHAEQGGVTVLDPQAAWVREDRPVNLLEYVARKREGLIYDDMDATSRFAKDECLTRRGVRSALCLPLIFKDQVAALLFLENAFIPGAFRSDRMTPLRMLLVHMAAAIENAGLFERLRAGEERYKAIFNATYQFTGLMSPDGILLEANQAALEFAGITLADVCGKPFWEARWWAGEEARVAQLRHAIERAARGEFVRYEVTLQGAGARTALIDFSIKPVWDEVGLVRLLVPEGRDITEMRDAEVKMRQRDAQLCTLVENIPGAVYRCDVAPPWRIAVISEEIRALTGWPADDFISGKVLYGDLIVPEDAAYVARTAAEAVRDCVPYSMEYRVRHQDGTIRWVYEQGRASYDASGHPVWLDGVNFDITQRKRMEQELQRLQKDYQTLFNEMIDGFAYHEMLYDEKGQPADYRFLAVNPAFERLTGLRADDIVGKRVLEVLPGTERHWIENYGNVAKTGRPISFENHSAELGKYFHVTAFRPAPDQFAVIFVDATERRIAEIYREMGRELLAVFAGADDDRHAMIQRALDILKMRTGFDAVGVRLREGEDFPYFAHVGFSEEFLRMENSLMARDAQGQLCRSEDGNVHLECTCGLVLSGKAAGISPFFTKGGSFWTNDARPLLDLPADQDPRFHPRNTCIHQGYVSFALIPIRKAGQTLGLIHLADKRKDCFSLDRIELLENIASSIGEAIERKQAEAERERLAEQLRQSEKMHAIGQLAGGIAHDFNNQLGGIMGFAEILADRLVDPTFKGYADKILSSATHAAHLTRQLLAFSRKGKCVDVPIDVHKIIAEVVELLSRSVDKRIEIKWHLDAAPSTVFADPTQLQNAILNLGLNARDAMPQGGALSFATRLETFAEAQPAEELAAGRYVQISVTDTGVGMSAETMKRLFEPFFTTKEEGKGTGLGLASTYGTVKTHGGTIRVVSAPGRGSTFSIFLPVHVEEAAKPHESVAASAKAPSGHGRILLVDDEPVILALGTAMLRKQGYEVTARGDPCEALELYRQEWPSINLVILDMVMPKMGGRDLFLAMQAINPGIKAILASGYSIDGEAQAIVDLGVAAFVQKPFRMGALINKVAETIGKEESGKR